MSTEGKTRTAGKYNPELMVWEDDRQPEMLTVGLSLVDTLRTAKPELELEQPAKRRTLDDMRRLSEHIRKVPVYEKK